MEEEEEMEEEIRMEIRGFIEKKRGEEWADDIASCDHGDYRCQRWRKAKPEL